MSIENGKIKVLRVIQKSKPGYLLFEAAQQSFTCCAASRQKAPPLDLPGMALKSC
jgi:hypothetical protein